MRLYPRNGIYYVEFARGKSISLKTKNSIVAHRAYKKLQEKSLDERLLIMNREDRSPLLSEFITEYLDHRKDREPSTRRADAYALQKFRDFFGDRPIDETTARVLEQFRSHLSILVGERTGKLITKNSVNAIIRHLKIAVKAAVSWGYVKLQSEGLADKEKKAFTLDKLKCYKVDLRKKIPISQEGVKILLAKAKELFPQMETAMAIQYYTGLGRAEVCQPLGISEGRITYRRKKTKKMKQIKYPAALAPYLAEFPEGIHTIIPWCVDTYTDKFSVIAKAAGFPGVTPHKLRHAFATHLLDNGARLEDVSELMDHSSVDITKRFYGHISQERLDQTINLLDLNQKKEAL